MKKVLFVTENKLMKYRIPIFELVNQDEDISLSIAHCGEKEDIELEQVCLKKYNVSKITYFKNLSNLCKEFDVVILMFYYHNLSIVRQLLCRKRKYKLILWGIGVRASYNFSFDSKSILNYLIRFLAKRADAVLFYSNYPINKYVDAGVEKSKLFVCNNTVKIVKINLINSKKNSFIFVGTLYKQKGLDLLLQSYEKAYIRNPNIYSLVIVGRGDLDYYKKIIEDKGLVDKISILGEIFDENILSKLFQSAILCFSPKQAGLTVLKSMGYGVPFVTSKFAITGGERLNISDNVNSFFAEGQEQLTNIMSDSFINPSKYVSVGQNAYDYYWTHRTPELMAQGILNAIKYVTNWK